MCKSPIPVLRIVAFVFLVVSFLACAIALLAPFWIHYKPTSETLTTTASAIPIVPIWNPSNSISSNSTPSPQPQARGQSLDDDEAPIYEGLWARCFNYTKCYCFFKDNMELEWKLPDWHKAAQGLFLGGIVILLTTLLTASFHVCCRCCKESVHIATVLGILTILAFLAIILSLAVYGGFACFDKNLSFEGEARFEWGYFVGLGGSAAALVAAILFICDGRRNSETAAHDGYEQAKMEV